MEETSIKDEIIEIIENADLNQLKEIHSLLTNYVSDHHAANGWESLSEYRKKRILKSIEQADAGLYMPAKEATERIRKKYGY